MLTLKGIQSEICPTFFFVFLIKTVPAQAICQNTLIMIQWPLLEKYRHINHSAMTDRCPEGQIIPVWIHRANSAYMTDEQPLITSQLANIEERFSCKTH